jgi:phosphoribosylglycinamide formyltransferase-1
LNFEPRTSNPDPYLPPPFRGRRLGILISGRGSNMSAIAAAVREGRLDAEIAVVISNRPDAEGLERAREAHLETLCLDHRGYPSRAEFDAALVDVLRARQVDLVCLAGFMRLLGPGFVNAFRHRILNIHPSLLPAFPGVDAQRRAWAHGVRISGVTVHLVTDELDAGPIVLQHPVPVRDDDTPETLAARILLEEHRIYPEAIALVLAGRWRLEGRRFVRTAQ